MPTKRTRRTRQTHVFDENCIGQLLKGPDACVLAGMGYFEPYIASGTRDLSVEQYAEMLETMRADWQKHGPELMRQWRTGEPITPKPWIFIVPHDGLPWAAEEFGEP